MLYVEKVRWWHQLTRLHINIDCLRNVSLKITKLHNFESSLFFIQFKSKFHYAVWMILNLDWI